MGLIALLSCQTAQIPDVQFIGSLGPSGAVTFDLLDASTSTMSLAQFAAQWDNLSDPKGPLVCVKTSDWAALKMDLEELCSWQSGSCTLAQQQALAQFTTNISKLGAKNANP